MSYLDEHGLARYDGLIKNWVTFKSGTVDGIDPLLNWQKTATAGAVTFYPLPAAPIDPIVNFLFTETGPAEGTKSPDNPSTITGVSEVKVTRCGANLFKYPYYRNTDGQNSAGTLKWEPKTDGTVRLIINNVAANSFYYMYQFTSNTVNSDGYFSLQTGKYRVSLKLISGTLPSSAGLYMSHYSGFFGETATIVNTVCDSEEEFTVSDYSQKHLFIFKITPGFSADVVVRPVLTLLSDADDAIEQYEGTDYTIDLGGTYYGGSVDLSAGTMTVTHVECVANGTNIYAQSSVGTIGNDYRHAIDVSIFGFPVPIIGDYQTSSSTHFSCNDSLFGIFGTFSQASRYLIIPDRSGLYSTNQSFNDWLKAQNVSGTPVKFVYTVANPFTVFLTPAQIYSLSQPDPYTPRTNTVYSDQVSVQVGYPKSPQATQNELTSAIVSLGGNV